MESKELGAKEMAGMGAGAIGGLVGGGKVGLGVAAAVAAVPVIGPFLAGAALIGCPIAGMVLGAQAGKNRPGMGFLALFVNLLPVPVPDGTATTADIPAAGEIGSTLS